MSIWFSLAAFLAFFNWFAVERKLRWLEYLSKPGVMLALLGWLWSSSQAGGLLLWFWLGALFCLAGDVFLMLPRRQFIAGLVSFLLGHLAYIAGFNQTWPDLAGWRGLAALLLLAGLLVYAWRYAARLQQALRQSGDRTPVGALLAYIAVICLMGLSAGLCLLRPDWPAGAAWLAAGGALSFLLSDSLLAWNQFIRPLPHASLLVMLTYHLGQFGILAGAFIWVS